MNPPPISRDQVLGRRLRAAQDRAVELLATNTEVAAVMASSSLRGTTRGVLVARIEAGLQQASAVAPAVARQAEAAWGEAQAAAWDLAQTWEGLCRSNAHKGMTSGGHDLSKEDLVQEGLIGAYQAALRWDPDRGIRFSTYARWWIRARCTRAVSDTGTLIRVPQGASETLRQLRKLQHQLEADGQTPTPSLLAELMEIPEERARELLTVWQLPASLEDPAVAGGCLGDLLAADTPSLDEVVMLRRMRDQVETVFPCLDQEDRELLLARMDGLTHRQIGEAKGVTRSWIQQLEGRALGRLRALLSKPTTTTTQEPSMATSSDPLVPVFRPAPTPSQCLVSGCGGKVRARHLCSTHYDQGRRQGWVKRAPSQQGRRTSASKISPAEELAASVRMETPAPEPAPALEVVAEQLGQPESPEQLAKVLEGRLLAARSAAQLDSMLADGAGWPTSAALLVGDLPPWIEGRVEGIFNGARQQVVAVRDELLAQARGLQPIPG